MRRFLFASLMLASLLACDRTAPQNHNAATAPTPTQNPNDPTQRIQWFAGDVAEALEWARSEEKPLFLYWGAEWCPPCNQIKSTIFTRPDFIEQTRKFVPVYLDGDTEGAQKWGEYFGTSGYPTLVVLNPDGSELTRLSSGMDGQRYPQALKLALANRQPIGNRLKRALDSPSELNADDWAHLALFAWNADMNRTVKHADLAPTLSTLHQSCPNDSSLYCQRLGMLALIAGNSDMDQWDRTDAQRLLTNILRDPEAVRLNLTEIQYEGADLLARWTSPASPERAALSDSMRKAMMAAYTDESLPIKQRLLTTRLLIDLENMFDDKVSDALVQEVQKRAAWASTEARTPYERQSLIYNAAYYLHEVGQTERAVDMLENELSRAVSPHYYMSYLSDFEQALGRPEKALAWAQRAWDEARGPATRIQWGVQYVQALTKIKPQAKDEIRQASTSVIEDVARQSGGFHQRNALRMQRLHAALQAWAANDGASRAAIADELRNKILRLCRENQGATHCEDFASSNRT